MLCGKVKLVGTLRRSFMSISGQANEIMRHSKQQQQSTRHTHTILTHHTLLLCFAPEEPKLSDNMATGNRTNLRAHLWQLNTNQTKSIWQWQQMATEPHRGNRTPTLILSYSNRTTSPP